MSNQHNKPLKAFEMTFLGEWYYIEIVTDKKIEVYTESPEKADSERIDNLVRYLRAEGFLSKEYLYG